MSYYPESKIVSRLSNPRSSNDMYNKEVVHILKDTYRTGLMVTLCGREFELGNNDKDSGPNYNWVKGTAGIIKSEACKRCMKLAPDWEY